MSQEMYVWPDAEDKNYLHMGFALISKTGKHEMNLVATFHVDAFDDTFGREAYLAMREALMKTARGIVPVTVALKVGHA